MLLITRRNGEGVVINGEIEIKILEIKGGRVKLGLDYPVGNTVYRQEVFAKMQEENRAAALMAAPTVGAPGMQAETSGTKIGTVLASLKMNQKSINRTGNQPANQKDRPHDNLDDDDNHDD